ncbi:MAG TPA: hypothetical protein VK278_07770, partial [Gaiellaceae bacterium]|nr:hypothetical protein [Gaiellaceae bacterium]
MALERDDERLQLRQQVALLRCREARHDADVDERSGVVVQAEQQRAERRAVGVPAEPGDDAVGGAVALHLHPLALPRRVGTAARLREHALVLGEPR